MATLSNPDVDIIAARLAAGEKVQTNLEKGLTLSPEQKILITKMVEKINQGDAEAALMIPATEFQHYATWKGTLDKAVLTGIDPVTQKRADRYPGTSDSEAARKTKITTTMETYQKLRATGWSSLLGPEQTFLKAEVEKFIRTRGILLRAYETTPGSGIVDAAKVEQILQEEGLGDALMAHLNEVWNPSKLADLSAKEQALAEKEAEVVNKKNEKTDLETNKTALTTTLTTETAKLATFTTPFEYEEVMFDHTKTRGVDKKIETKNALLSRLRGSADIADYVNAYDRAAKAEKDLKGNPNLRSARTELDRANRDMSSFSQNTDQKKDQVAMFRDLSEEKEEIQDKVDAATKAKTEQEPVLVQEIAAKELEIQAARRQLQPLLEEREAMGKELEETVDKAMYVASGKFLAARVQDRSNKARQETQNVVNEAKKGLTDQEAADLQAIQDHIQKVIDVRYLETREVKNRDKRFWQFDKDDKVTTYVPNEIQINADRKILFNPAQGPGRIAKDIVLNSICSGGYYPTTLKCIIPGEEKRRKAIMENKEYMDSLKSQVAIKILGGMTESGMHITPQEITLMGTSSELKPMFQQWIDRNAETKKFMADAKANGLIKNGDMSEFMRKYGTTAMLALLLITLFGVGSTVGIGTALGSLGVAAGGLLR